MVNVSIHRGIIPFLPFCSLIYLTSLLIAGRTDTVVFKTELYLVFPQAVQHLNRVSIDTFLVCKWSHLLVILILLHNCVPPSVWRHPNVVSAVSCRNNSWSWWWWQRRSWHQHLLTREWEFDQSLSCSSQAVSSSCVIVHVSVGPCTILDKPLMYICSSGTTSVQTFFFYCPGSQSHSENYSELHPGVHRIPS